MEYNTVQTWLPYPSFQDSVKVLDISTLSAQRLDVLCILDVIHQSNTAGVSDEPAAPARLVAMWEGYEPQLCEYGIEVCEEWARRGYEPDGTQSNLEWHLDMATSGEYTLEKPPWFGDIQVHHAHQSALLRKFPDHYSVYFDVADDLEMVWPGSE
jgi:hypothetical protein